MKACSVKSMQSIVQHKSALYPTRRRMQILWWLEYIGLVKLYPRLKLLKLAIDLRPDEIPVNLRTASL